MEFVCAKLLPDENKENKQRRTIFKAIPPCDYEQLIAFAARRIPADASEMDLLVNGPMTLLLPVIRLCHLHKITLTLTLPMKDTKETTQYNLLRYWACSSCNGRFSEDHKTCPYCGGLGYYLPSLQKYDPVGDWLAKIDEQQPD